MCCSNFKIFLQLSFLRTLPNIVLFYCNYRVGVLESIEGCYYVVVEVKKEDAKRLYMYNLLYL